MMQNSKYFNLLRLLSPKAFRQFGKFLQSPYCNGNKKLIELYNQIKKRYPDLDHRQLSKERLFPKLFPDKEKYQDNLIRLLLVEGVKAIHLFLAMEEVKNEEGVSRKLLVQGMGKHKNYLVFEKQTEELIYKLEQQPKKGIKYYLQLFELNLELYLHPETAKLRPGIDSLEKSMANLDLFFVLTKLRLSGELLSREKNLSEKQDIYLLEPVMELVKHQSFDQPIFKIYHNILLLLKDGFEEDIFFKLKNIFEIHLDGLAPLEQGEILPFLLNQANSRGIKGGIRYSQIMFELYQFGLEKSIWIINGRLSRMVFYNLIYLGCMLKKVDWVESFLTEYQNYLEPRDQEVLVPLGRASIFIEQEQFWEAESILNQLQGHEPIFELSIRRLSLSCLYEIYIRDQKYYDLISVRIKSFEKYLNRNKKFSKTKVSYDLNFCFFLLKMVNGFYLSRKEKTKYWLSLKRELINEKRVSKRTWLMNALTR